MGTVKATVDSGGTLDSISSFVPDLKTGTNKVKVNPHKPCSVRCVESTRCWPDEILCTTVGNRFVVLRQEMGLHM